MKAYKIKKLSKISGITVDAGYELHIPFLECLVCCPEWKNWGQGYYEFPTLKFSFLNKTEFNNRKIINLEEFKKLKKRIESAAGRPVNLYPGASIGELSGISCRKKLEDFVWGRLIPQISKRANEVLIKEGIQLTTADCSIKYRGQKIDSHLALQIQPVAMMTAESLERHKIFHCPRCGNYMWPPKPDPIVPGGFLIDKSKWPKGQHLVQMAETLEVIVSEQFIEAVKKNKLTGIAFEECGQFV